MVWTTTPWTLPANVAIAVHPELEYSRVTVAKHPGRSFILATARLVEAERILGGDVTVVESFPGAALAGLRYRRPLDIVPLPDGDREVVLAVRGLAGLEAQRHRAEHVARHARAAHLRDRGLPGFFGDELTA